MIQIEKENIKTSKTIVSDVNDVAFEWDIIVPDSKPDILSILKTDALINVTSKEIMQDRAVINGVCKINILYIPSDNEQPVKNIETLQHFTHVMELKGLRQSMILDLGTTINSINTNVINSRKVSLNCSLCFAGNVIDENEMEFIKEIDYEGIEFLSKQIKTYKTICESENVITISEELDVPMGKPSVLDILKVDLKLNNKVSKTIPNRVVLKGDLLISTLYNGEIEENILQYMEHEIPFTEILDIDGIKEDNECDTEYILGDLNYSLKENSEGEKRILCVDATIKIKNKSYENILLNGVVDAYSTTNQINIEKNNYSIDEIIDELKTQIVIKDTVHYDDIPAISKIYSVNSTPQIQTVTVLSGKIKVDGVIKTDVIYHSNSSENYVNSIYKEIPFTSSIECENAIDGYRCEVKAECLHSGYNIASDNELEFRTNLEFKARIKGTSNNQLIKEIEIDDNKAIIKNRPSVVIYFCNNEDEGLWDIAKKYKTTIKQIIELNALASENSIKKGTQLLIP